MPAESRLQEIYSALRREFGHQRWWPADSPLEVAVGAVLTQNTALSQAFHTLSAAFLTGGAFMVGIAAYHLARKKHVREMKTSLRLGLITVVIAGLLTAVSGDVLGKVMFKQQPMKMAAAEALWDGQAPAPFSTSP